MRRFPRTLLIGFLLAVIGAGLGLQEGEAQVHYLEEQAKEGNSIAQNKLGRMYLFGRGVPKDPEQAAEWFRKSANRGYPRSEYDLGLLYTQGEGVPKNSEEAVKWFRRAANKGYSRAQYKLGELYTEGVGVPKDDVEAYKWYNLAAAQGDDEAARARQRLARGMTRDQIGRAQKLSVEWKRR